jgi:hypothetical protein
MTAVSPELCHAGRRNVIAWASEPHLYSRTALSKPTQDVPRVVPVRHQVRLHQAENLVAKINDHLSIRCEALRVGLKAYFLGDPRWSLSPQIPYNFLKLAFVSYGASISFNSTLSFITVIVRGFG